MVSGAVVRLNNLSVRLRSPKCRPEELLILIPSCLQNSKCTQKVAADVNNCKRCGQCPVGAMLQIGDDCGVRVACAAGGRLALSIVRDSSVKCVVAVACDKELRAGVMGAFPKPVRAIENLRPHGPCRDTSVSADEVRSAVSKFLRIPKHSK